MIQLSCSQLKKYYGAQLVLENITFEVQEGERAAIIGKNGSGKSTILKLITRQETPDGGCVSIRKNAVTGYLEQLPDYGAGMTVKDVCSLAFEKFTDMKEQMMHMEKEMEAAGREAGGMENKNSMEEILRRYTGLQIRYEAEGGYETEERFSRICIGLKLSESFLKAEFSTLSGGEKTLVCLAKTLLREPDILILDEPTNHLDMSMLQWLEEYLKVYRGTVLLVSHDRSFLDAVATKIIEVEEGRAEEYQGNYSCYLKEKEDRLQLRQEAFKEQQKQIKSMEKAVSRMKVWADSGDNEMMFRRAASMQKRLDRMEKMERPKKECPGMQAEFVQGERSGKDVLHLEGVTKRFGEKLLFQNLNLDVFYQEHVALLGKNGCGKSTLLRIILGELAADEGEIRLGSSVRVGYLPQHVSFPREDINVLEVFREGLTMTEEKAREVLSRYLFTGENVFKRVENLSGGEKSRLYLAKLMQTGIYTTGAGINFLILDEPTNHLDIISRENLENALEQFEGTILTVSHDRYFLNKIATGMVEMTAEGIRSYRGNYDDYWQEKEKMAADGSGTLPGQTVSRRSNGADKRLEKGPAANTGGRNKFRQKQLELEIADMEDEKNRCEKDIMSAGDDYEKLMKLEERRKTLEKRIEEKMEEWLQLQEG